MNTAQYTPIVFSHFQTSQILHARDSGKQQAETSPNLGRTTVQVTLTREGVAFPGGELLYWMDIESINSTENNCFLAEGGHVRKIAVFSKLTNRLYSLMPTENAPGTSPRSNSTRPHLKSHG